MQITRTFKCSGIEWRWTVMGLWVIARRRWAARRWTARGRAARGWAAAGRDGALTQFVLLSDHWSVTVCTGSSVVADMRVRVRNQ